MTLDTLKAILKDLRKTPHRGFNTSYFPCDLEKIGSPGRPYRNCTCGLDKRIEEVRKEIKKLES